MVSKLPKCPGYYYFKFIIAAHSHRLWAALCPSPPPPPVKKAPNWSLARNPHWMKCATQEEWEVGLDRAREDIEPARPHAHTPQCKQLPLSAPSSRLTFIIQMSEAGMRTRIRSKWNGGTKSNIPAGGNRVPSQAWLAVPASKSWPCGKIQGWDLIGGFHWPPSSLSSHRRSSVGLIWVSS